MNWYKAAEEVIPRKAVSLNAEQFRALDVSFKARIQFNISVLPEVQLLYFTEKYEGKDRLLWRLAGNRKGLTPETQILFFTEPYGNKANTLSHLVKNPSFLRDFTLKQLLQIKKVARGGAKLQVLSKRLEQIVGVQ